MVRLFLYTDGASRGNPGPAAYGFVLINDAGNVLHEEGRKIGMNTNNVAEYTALREGLKQALLFGASSVECFSDSQLVVKQMSGEYKIKQAHLQEIAQEIRGLAERIGKVNYTWVRRNTGPVERADALCNLALDGAI